MSKRFTDTDKWKRTWWGDLDSKAKLAFIYLTDNCDHAGIWIVNFPLMSFQIGFKVTAPDLESWLGDKLVKVDNDRYCIPSFFQFQYGDAGPGFKAKQSAIKILQKYEILDAEGNTKELLPNSSELSPDCPSISIGIGKSIGIGRIGECEGKGVFDLEALYKSYPLKKGKLNGMKKLKAVVKTQEDFDRVSKAISRYCAQIKSEATPKEFIKHFSTFMSCWEDFLDEDVGQVSPEMASSNGSGDGWIGLVKERGWDDPNRL